MQVLEKKELGRIVGGIVDGDEYAVIKHMWSHHAEFVAAGNYAQARACRDAIYAYRSNAMSD